ncbi:hypothetical protein BD779DRAFT_1568683 [Infundibulicybe gibba]|nr:hypothetical protein BD779DRAFT_1568683 [Infundibulicybe gibba]
MSTTTTVGVLMNTSPASFMAVFVIDGSPLAFVAGYKPPLPTFSSNHVSLSYTTNDKRSATIVGPLTTPAPASDSDEEISGTGYWYSWKIPSHDTIATAGCLINSSSTLEGRFSATLPSTARSTSLCTYAPADGRPFDSDYLQPGTCGSPTGSMAFTANIGPGRSFTIMLGAGVIMVGVLKEPTALGSIIVGAGRWARKLTEAELTGIESMRLD